VDVKCDASHDGHDCSVPGACTKALNALLQRVEARRHEETLEQERRLIRGEAADWPAPRKGEAVAVVQALPSNPHQGL
jgi:hypothetical protein